MAAIMCPKCLSFISAADIPAHAEHADKESDGTIHFPTFA